MRHFVTITNALRVQKEAKKPKAREIVGGIKERQTMRVCEKWETGQVVFYRI